MCHAKGPIVWTFEVNLGMDDIAVVQQCDYTEKLDTALVIRHYLGNSVKIAMANR